MKTPKSFTFFILSFFLVSYSCSNATNDDDAITENYTINQNFITVSYGDHPQQEFDLYLPAHRSATTTKTLVLIHGGGWTSGDKNDMNYIVNIISKYLPEYAIVNMNYRLATNENPAFPMQIEDIKTVMRKLKNENYGISDDFGFIGVSAGGQLSLLYSYAYNNNHDIKMVCSIVGPTDFTDPNYQDYPEVAKAFDSAIGVDYADHPDHYKKQLSPLYRATPSSPPTILFYGNADPIIPTSQGVNMHNKLDELSVYNEFTLYNGGHGDWAFIDQVGFYTKLVNFIKNKF